MVSGANRLWRGSLSAPIEPPKPITTKRRGGVAAEARPSVMHSSRGSQRVTPPIPLSAARRSRRIGRFMCILRSRLTSESEALVGDQAQQQLVEAPAPALELAAQLGQQRRVRVVVVPAGREPKHLADQTGFELAAVD